MTMPPQTAEPAVKFGIHVPALTARAIDELRIKTRIFSRSALVGRAIDEMADRELPADWRETLSAEGSESE